MLRIAWSTVYAHPLPENHRFPMEKYELLPEQLVYEGTVTDAHFFEPDPVDTPWILRTHEADYWQKLNGLALSKSEIRKTGFPLSRQLVDRELIITQGTIDCALYALEYGVAMNIAGGTHHAFTAHGEGFCLLNDIAVAANYLLDHGYAHQVLVVDLDVHQGNGTAQIFRGNPSVFTFSMHGARNYPMHKESSDLDIGLADDTGDEAYLRTLDAHLGRIVDEFMPDFIFYQSGVDVLATDKLGRLALSTQGCMERDRRVLSLAKANQIPLVASMGGGYSPDIRHIVDAHANTYRLAQEIYF